MPNINQRAGIDCTAEEQDQDKLARESLLTNLDFLQRNFKVYNALQQSKCKMVVKEGTHNTNKEKQMKEKHDANRDVDRQPIAPEEAKQGKQKNKPKRKKPEQGVGPNAIKKAKHAATKKAAPPATKVNTKVTSLLTKPTLIQKITYLLYDLLYTFFQI